MHEIVPNLFLADYESARLHTPDNAFIVNCSKDLPMIRDQGVRISVDDNGSQEAMHTMLKALPSVVDLIQTHLQLQPVVVHCQAGRQRSATVIAAYLYKYGGYSLEDAVHYVRDKKRDAFFWNVNFRDSLEWFSKLYAPSYKI
jgi:dual specificity MAP kinase phosphatase